MSDYSWALFLHLLGVAVLAGGIAVAGVGFQSAKRRERPSEIALLLGTARSGVLLVALGGLVVLVGGFWLIEATSLGLDEGWLGGSLLLFVAGTIAGAVGGQRPKAARKLAERLAREGDEPSAELDRLLRDRLTAVLNVTSAAAMLGVLLLMIWKPG